MPAERWAYSVVDHKDALKIARDLILFDRLLLPSPESGAPWKPEWDQQGMLNRLAQLGERAIHARWTPERRADWAATFADLQRDAEDVNDPDLAYAATRRVLIEQARAFRPAGVPLVETYEGFQSEAAFVAHSSAANAEPRATGREETVLLVIAQRLAVPVAEAPEEALKRTLEMTDADSFRQSRAALYDWQRDLVARGHRPRDIVEATRGLAAEAERAAGARGREFGLMTAATAISITIETTAQFADLGDAAGAFGLGVFAFGTFMTLRDWFAAREAAGAPSGPTPEAAVGAMFHEVKTRLGWEIG